MSNFGERRPDGKMLSRHVSRSVTPMSTPDLVLENRFQAPPAFVKAWLTDFRPDDGRYFGDPNPIKVERRGHTVHREQQTPMGPLPMVVHVAKDDAWSVEGEQRTPDGAVVFRFRLQESVRPNGEGTLHRVEMFLVPVAPGVDAMLPQLVAGWKTNLEKGFEAIAREIAAEARAGKSPTA